MSKIMNKKAKEFLFEYLNNAAPTGFESSGQKIWLSYLKPYIDEHHVDHYGTTYGIINPGRDFKVVIEGHADEIAWYVSYITKEGFLHVIRNGGSDHLIAPSMRVNVHTDNGVIKGIFGWPAIHTRKGKNAKLVPELTNIFVDVGAADKDEVLAMGIHPGTVITFDADLMELNKKYFVGRALDNRMGGFCIAQVARMLKEKKKKLPFTLYVVNAVQEEVGLRGAQMITETIRPNLAIVTDVTHDTNTPLVDVKLHGDVTCGSGPTVTYAPAVHNTLRTLILDVAKAKKIPVQLEASSRVTGTDTDAFAYSNGGVPSALISLPLRYMHTTVETVSMHDMDHLIHLIYETLLKIKPTINLKYL